MAILFQAISGDVGGEACQPFLQLSSIEQVLLLHRSISSIHGGATGGAFRTAVLLRGFARADAREFRRKPGRGDRQVGTRAGTASASGVSRQGR